MVLTANPRQNLRTTFEGTATDRARVCHTPRPPGQQNSATPHQPLMIILGGIITQYGRHKLFAKASVPAMKRILTLLVIALCFGLQIHSQSQTSSPPKKLGSFGTDFGTTQFLPGGIVIVTEEGARRQYAWRGRRFVRVPNGLPPELRGWKSFDWEGVDYLDQIDKQDFESEIRHSLPGGSKVKKVLEVVQSRSGRHLEIVCYSLPTTEQNEGVNHADLFLVGLDRMEGTPYFAYTERWSLKLAAAASYGNFTLERVPGAGLLGVLYSSSAGGSSASADVDIYRIIP
ncbi:MAG: hypothetical protein WAM91_09245 [Candidatus Acidiferrales bacterium]